MLSISYLMRSSKLNSFSSHMITSSRCPRMDGCFGTALQPAAFWIEIFEHAELFGHFHDLLFVKPDQRVIYGEIHVVDLRQHVIRGLRGHLPDGQSP